MEKSKEILSTNIKRLLKEHSFSRDEIANKLEVKYTTFCDWAKGRSYPKMEYINKMAEIFEICSYALTTENPDMEGAHIDYLSDKFEIKNAIYPIYKKVSHNNEGTDLDFKASGNVPPEWMNLENEIATCNNKYIGFFLPDDTMAEEYNKNDTVIFRCQDKITTDGDYLIQKKTNNGLKTVFRRVKITDDKFIIYPLNQTNSIKALTTYIDKNDFYNKCIVLGKIKRHIKDFD